jgi:hypothetical protein
VRIVAVDPGLKPGCVELDWHTGAVLQASHRLDPWVFETPWGVACTEGQWYFGGRRARGARPGGGRAGSAGPDVNDLLTLAFRAGFTLACIPAARSLRIPPSVWREPYGNLSKEQVQKKIADNLTAPERRIIVECVPKSRHGDVLDAIGIGRGALRVLHTTTKYDWILSK